MALRWRSRWAAYAIACCLVVAGLLPFFWSLPLIRSVQFPFRALPFAEFGLATAIALAPRGARLVALLVAPALALSATFLLAPRRRARRSPSPCSPSAIPTCPRICRRARGPTAGRRAGRSTSPPAPGAGAPGRGHDRAHLLLPGLAGDLRRRRGRDLPRSRHRPARPSRDGLRDERWAGPRRRRPAPRSACSPCLLLALLFRPRARRDAPC